MILIADSGASKTDWILIERKGDAPKEFSTQGLNPFYIDTAGILDIIEKDLLPFMESSFVKSIFFYGAGCSTVYNRIIVEDALSAVFPEAEINIGSDLLGAARASLGNKEGIACILGTGSNSCYYNGREIAANIPSLGYIFGDEGSGADLGKQLCADFMLGRLPSALHKAFTEKYNLTRENILHSAYRLPFPNRFLASFCEFLPEQLTEPYVHNLVSESFSRFLSNNVAKYDRYDELPVHFTGSVAFHFRDILLRIAPSLNINIHSVEQSPIRGLIRFHAEENIT